MPNRGLEPDEPLVAFPGEVLTLLRDAVEILEQTFWVRLVLRQELRGLTNDSQLSLELPDPLARRSKLRGLGGGNPGELAAVDTVTYPCSSPRAWVVTMCPTSTIVAVMMWSRVAVRFPRVH
ncbi:MAG: hypothetical protein JWR90_1017 [Marmoricola sp.]|nr:hypothetical protein [Marmoricola sp.]